MSQERPMIDQEPTNVDNSVGETVIMDDTQRDNKSRLLGLPESDYRKFLPEHLQKQVGGLMDLYRKYNDILPSIYQQRAEDFDSHETFYLSFLVDRNRRAHEVASPEYQEVIEFANSLMPADTLMVMCMDGRVKLIHTNGFSAGVGSSIRTAGGTIEGFEEGEGTLTLRSSSDFARLIDKKMRDSSFSKPIAEVFDSHWTCAARIGEEEATGNSPKHDAGLYRDVQYKKRMAQATREYIHEKHRDSEKNAVILQTTFNPTTGYLYMGLETDAALSVAEEKATDKKYAEFGKDVLKELISEGRIISTGALIAEPEIKRAFENHRFEPDWRRQYVDTARRFWNNISELKEELMPTLKRKVIEVYPGLENDSREAHDELEERSMLILTNTFNTFLHNSDHNEMLYLDMNDHDYEGEEHYPYGIHNEQGVKISEGGHPVYDMTMFVVYPGDIDSVETAAKIVRANRLNKRVSDVLGGYQDDPGGFAKSPVPVIMQEIIRQSGTRVNEEEWKALREADWDDMPANWDVLTDNEFAEYISSKGIDSYLIATHIQILRHKMIGLYNHKDLNKHLRQLYKTVMPGLCDQNRNFQAVIPFAKVGRAKQNKNGFNGFSSK